MIVDVYPPELKMNIKVITKSRFCLSSWMLEKAHVDPSKDNLYYIWMDSHQMKVFNNDQIPEKAKYSMKIYKAQRITYPKPTTVWAFINIPNLNGAFFVEVDRNTIRFKEINVSLNLTSKICVERISGNKIQLPSLNYSRYIYCKLYINNKIYNCLIPNAERGLCVDEEEKTINLYQNINFKESYVGCVKIECDGKMIIGSDESIILVD